MNAISSKASIAPDPHFPLTVADLAAELAKQQDLYNKDPGGKPGHSLDDDRRYGHVRALQDLILTMKSHDVAGCVAQMIVLSTRFGDDADLETVDDIRCALESRTDQLQALIFRMLRLLNLDPAPLGADAYLNFKALESEGYTPPWARAVREDAR